MNPQARNDALLVEELDGEAVVYDQRHDRVHRLDARAYRIWRESDGQATVAQLADRTGCERELIELTLDKLNAADLLHADGPRLYSRRRLVSSAAALAAAPIVVSVAAPTPAMAASPPPKPGTEEGDCIYKLVDGGWRCQPNIVTSTCCSEQQVGTTNRVKCAPCP